MIVIAASFWPTSQPWVLQVLGTRSNQGDCARRVRAGLSSARVAATGIRHVCTERSIEYNFFRMSSLTINMSDSVSGITPIQAIYGVIDASLLRLPTMADLERVIEQVSLFLADVSQCRAARVLSKTERLRPED